jgi:hypothetical protein
MADDLSTPADPRMAAIGQVLLQARLVVYAWQEFGSSANFARQMAALDEALTAYQRDWQQQGEVPGG